MVPAAEHVKKQFKYHRPAGINTLVMLLAGVMNDANNVPDGADPVNVIVVCAPVLGTSNSASVGAGGVVVVLPSKNKINPVVVPDGPIEPWGPWGPVGP